MKIAVLYCAEGTDGAAQLVCVFIRGLAKMLASSGVGRFVLAPCIESPRSEMGGLIRGRELPCISGEEVAIGPVGGGMVLPMASPSA